ncbi:35789_t:CDS:2 [Racocetra persica]|uniref:35789_t:CDS:1 n=1 Tax=Racocetra persica TaxID=160502 RepID=A0ACA9N9X0_9GLOM|nr:35789_t:CDS:2 [Racocetra persica]
MAKKSDAEKEVPFGTGAKPLLQEQEISSNFKSARSVQNYNNFLGCIYRRRGGDYSISARAKLFHMDREPQW